MKIKMKEDREDTVEAMTLIATCKEEIVSPAMIFIMMKAMPTILKRKMNMKEDMADTVVKPAMVITGLPVEVVLVRKRVEEQSLEEEKDNGKTVVEEGKTDGKTVVEEDMVETVGSPAIVNLMKKAKNEAMPTILKQEINMKEDVADILVKQAIVMEEKAIGKTLVVEEKRDGKTLVEEEKPDGKKLVEEEEANGKKVVEEEEANGKKVVEEEKADGNEHLDLEG
jgi:hypothetical protein